MNETTPKLNEESCSVSGKCLRYLMEFATREGVEAFSDTVHAEALSKASLGPYNQDSTIYMFKCRTKGCTVKTYLQRHDANSTDLIVNGPDGPTESLSELNKSCIKSKSLN